MQLSELVIQRVISIIIGCAIALAAFVFTVVNWGQHWGRLVGFAGLLTGWVAVLLMVIFEVVQPFTAINQVVWASGGFVLAGAIQMLSEAKRERLELYTTEGEIDEYR